MNKTIAVLALAVVSTAALAQVTVYSNNAGGDAFTDAGIANPGAFQQINSYTGPNSETWYYNEVKDSTTIGIDTSEPWGAGNNGSVHLTALGGTHTNGKASISLVRNDAGSLGAFDSLTHWNADIRTESSDLQNQSMILRLYVANQTSQGFLVFDSGWTPANAPVITYGQWQNMDFITNANSLYVRGTNSLVTTLGTSAEMSFASVQAALSGQGFQVLSANAGWGTATAAFEGYMDNYTLGFNGQATTYDFEAVPEPMTMGILAAGAALAARRRKKK